MKLKSNFHPSLFGFAGHSGAGKSTLIEKLIQQFTQYKVGYIKHDAHHFEMDHEGKDTHRMYQAGAALIYINDREHQALQVRGESYTLEREYFKDCDLVLVEGHKYADIPKIVFLNETLLEEIQSGKVTNVHGTISPDGKGLEGIPSFQRDDVEGIAAFIESKIQPTTELYGLILSGGMSSRMGVDKARLEYHGRPQVQYLYELLHGLGLKTYVSCRSEQAHNSEYHNLSVITDRFLGFGPLGGILSAQAAHPDKAWLVVACDLPLITTETMQELIAARDPMKQATAYYNLERKHYEPLFAIYEPSIHSRMLHFLGEGFTCPQKVLFNASIKRLELSSAGALTNINTPEERAKVLDQLGVQA